MATYSSPSISGYNANPPSDDGTATEDNTVKWATVKDKVGDPIKTYADAISSAVSTSITNLNTDLGVGADLASAAALPVDASGFSHDVTGTTSITSLEATSTNERKFKILQFDGALTLTHHATDLILPGAANITTAAGDIGVFYQYASGDWRLVSYMRAAGGSPYLTLGTSTATTSGTTVDISGIPSGVRRITFSLNGVSTNGTDTVILQLGDSGGIETSGYSGSTANQSGGTATGWSSGIIVDVGSNAANVRHGNVSLFLIGGSNSWSASVNTALSNSASQYNGAGTKQLSATLTQVRLTTASGTDEFDAGAINVLYD